MTLRLRLTRSTKKEWQPHHRAVATPTPYQQMQLQLRRKSAPIGANPRHLRSIPIHELRLPVIPSKCEESHYQEDIEGVKGS